MSGQEDTGAAVVSASAPIDTNDAASADGPAKQMSGRVRTAIVIGPFLLLWLAWWRLGDIFLHRGQESRVTEWLYSVPRDFTVNWFNFAGRPNDYGVRSDVFNGVTPGVPASPADVHCTVIRARDRVHVVRQPATLVDDAIVIDFADNAWQLDKYVVHIYYRSRPQPPPAKAPTIISKNGLIGEYRFTGNANDRSGKANHGIAERITATADRFGAPAKAIRFETYGSVKIPAPEPLTNGNLAISIWVNCRAFPELTEWYPWSSCILSQHDGAGARHFQLASHRRYFSWNRFQRIERRLSATEHAEVNRWYHLVAQTDGVVHELYVDGVLQDSTRGDYTFNPDMPLYVGRNGDQERSLYFNGAVDDHIAIAPELRLLLFRDNVSRYCHYTPSEMDGTPRNRGVPGRS